MKRWAVWGLAAMLLLALAGCGADKAPMPLNQVRGLVLEKGYTAEAIQENLAGVHYQDIWDSWGEPDRQLSGLWGDIWYLNDYRYITLCYDPAGCVQHIALGDRSS